MLDLALIILQVNADRENLFMFAAYICKLKTDKSWWLALTDWQFNKQLGLKFATFQANEKR